MTVLAISSLVFILLLQHPFITYPLSLRLIRHLRGSKPLRREAGDMSRTVDIVFCACNEERSIEQKIENCLSFKAADPNVQVRAYSDGSSDATAEILTRHAGEIDAIISNQRLGKSTGMNTLLNRSTADIIVFTDANTTLKSDAIEKVRAYFEDPEIGCVCGNLLYVNADESTTAGVGSLYWRLEQAIKLLETETGSTMGADGALFAIRRSLFQNVPAYIIDDMFTSLSTMCAGYRVVQSQDFIAYERSVTKTGEEFRRKVRIACRAFNCHRLLWPHIAQSGLLNVYKYVSHKWLRWLAGFWMGLAGACILALTLASQQPWLAVLGICCTVGVIYAGRRGVSSTAASLNEIAVSFIAATYGVWKSLRGERFQTWSVAATARPSAALAPVARVQPE